MAKLKIFLLCILNQIVFSLKKKTNKITLSKQNFRFLNQIHNIPVDNNIPMIVGDINKDNQNQDNLQINLIPIIPMITDLNNSINIITNTSIQINNTNRDPMCTPECCAGCEVQFQILILQKNCIINICKCQIIEINSEIEGETNETSGLKDDIKDIKEDKTFFLLMNNKKKLSNLGDEESYSYYFIILFLFVIYEVYIVYKITKKDFEVNNELILNKDKEKKIKDYMDLLYDDEDLIECLI